MILESLSQCIFDIPMCHITSNKVKTSMSFTWCGPDRLDRGRYSRDESSEGHYSCELTVVWIGIDTVEMRGAKVIMQVNSL